MPATSQAQKTLFCVALAIKRGETPASYSEEAARLAEENSEETLKDYCEKPIKK